MARLTYDSSGFYLDGKPYTIISGTIHYFRVIPEYWRDRLEKLKACGFNTLETYVAWNIHERREGEFDFSGGADLEGFVSIAEELGLNVILRPGPYICAEWDMGGLPSWLLNYSDIKLRCYNELYLEKVRSYMTAVFEQLRGHFGKDGGAIIAVQIENEYGSYGDDKRYLRALADMYHELGCEELLFTSDGDEKLMLSGGTLPEYLATCNFGSSPETAFASLREFRPDCPYMCCEFWNGWYDTWYTEHHTRDDLDAAEVFGRMLDMGASVNFYMFCGGTNFGMHSGANQNEFYTPTVTSYDYDAVLSEAGDITPKYMAIRDQIEKHFGALPELKVKNTEKRSYGKLRLTSSVALFDKLDKLSVPVENSYPMTMEQLGGDFGFVLYSSEIEGPFEEHAIVIDDPRDRCMIFTDGKFRGVIEKTRRNDEVRISAKAGEKIKLDILVENMGRINYGPMTGDRKGIVAGIRLERRYHFGWTMRYLSMENLIGADLFSENASSFGEYPSIMHGTLTIDDEPADTFVSLDGFTKGIVEVNGFNIGRYWNVGPQKTLYLPAPLLRRGDNDIVVFELEGCKEPVIEFTDKHDLGMHQAEN